MINSSSDNVKKLNSINRRMFITGSVKFFIMIGLVSRLFFLQVKENKKYLTLSDKNRIREWKLAPVRGEFHDYFGNLLQAVPCFTIRFMYDYNPSRQLSWVR